MQWSEIISETLKTSGLAEWLKNLVEENKDEVDNIEKYLQGMLVKMISGEDNLAFKDFQHLKKPTDKLKAARWLIGKAREERRQYEEFKKSVVTVLGTVLGSAVKTLL